MTLDRCLWNICKLHQLIEHRNKIPCHSLYLCMWYVTADKMYTLDVHTGILLCVGRPSYVAVFPSTSTSCTDTKWLYACEMTNFRCLTVSTLSNCKIAQSYFRFIHWLGTHLESLALKEPFICIQVCNGSMVISLHGNTRSPLVTTNLKFPK